MYEQVLKQAGYKLTRPRKAVLDYFAKSKHPVSASDMYKSLAKDMDKATIYRILDALEDIGIVFKEYNDKESLYYLAQKQHHHVICRKCGHIECVPCNHAFSKIKNFKNVEHQLLLTGLCNKCNN